MLATAIRLLAKRSSPGLKKAVDPKVTPEQCEKLSRVLYDIVKEHGPLSIGDAWDHVQATGLRALTSKKHMKLMLKWMREREMLKLICNHNAPTTQFLYSVGSTKPQNAAGESSIQAPKFWTSDSVMKR